MRAHGCFFLVVVFVPTYSRNDAHASPNKVNVLLATVAVCSGNQRVLNRTVRPWRSEQSFLQFLVEEYHRDILTSRFP